MTVVVPAFNEQHYLPATLAALKQSLALLPPDWSGDILVVDDRSGDGTAMIAAAHEVTVVTGRHEGIGAARNTGAGSTAADLLVFVDADTVVPTDAFPTVANVFDRHGVLAISIPSDYVTERRCLKPLLAWWRWYAPRHHSTQGVFQAFERRLFLELGGYDETLCMAEDTDLFDRAIAGVDQNEWRILLDLRVQASMRRYEQGSALAIWMLTNPLTTRYLRRYRSLWRRWYESPPR